MKTDAEYAARARVEALTAARNIARELENPILELQGLAGVMTALAHAPAEYLEEASLAWVARQIHHEQRRINAVWERLWPALGGR